VPERDGPVTAITNMAQTLTALYYHVVFSTKKRVELIRPDIEDELYAYIGGILNNHHSKLLEGNGDQKHVHLLLSLSKLVLIPEVIGDIKRSSSKWIKTKGGMLTKFGWQDGYSVFTVGHTQLEAVKKYIANQKEHHKNVLFEDEMRDFYQRYEIDFDERYVWD
ncbi:MAG: IS200/IS605 family transposase, partial [Pyrinomonadaceae bacterium]